MIDRQAHAATYLIADAMNNDSTAKPRSKPRKPAAAKSVVVVGASAGGMQALVKLIRQFDASFPAAILVVNHMAMSSSSEPLLNELRKVSSLACKIAVDKEGIVAGHVYLARPDHHLMVSGEKIAITKGARENRARPAIDSLFRSAAVSYGNRVVAVLLTGYLDDGSAGMVAVKRCGGTCVVQDPDDSAYPDMPQNALRLASIDHCLPIDQMGALLTRLVKRRKRKATAIPDDIAIEASIAERVLSDLESVEELGEQVPFNCPGCGGVLWQMKKGKLLRYRCHTGHSYTAAALMDEQKAKMEETLWIALRMFEENRNLLIRMGAQGTASQSYIERVEQAKVHIDRIRAMLKSTTGTS